MIFYILYVFFNFLAVTQQTFFQKERSATYVTKSEIGKHVFPAAFFPRKMETRIDARSENEGFS